MVFPDPVISLAISTKDKAMSEKLGTALGKMVAEDPSFHVEVDQESGETILKGMGELHLDIKVDILRRSHGVAVDVGAPQVAYRETVTRAIEDTYIHKKQTGGSGQFAKIEYTIEPTEPGEGFVFESKIVGGRIPKEFIPAVEKGFKVMKEEGPGLCGFPPARLQSHTERRWLPRGRFVADGVRERPQGPPSASSMPKAGPQLLEPIMKVDVFVPERQRGRCHRRPQSSSRHGELAGEGPHQRPHQGRCPPQRDVRLHR